MRVLLLTQRVPYAPNRGDRVRAFHIARLLKRTAQVDLVALAHDAEEERHARDLESLVASATVVRIPHVRNTIRAAGSLGTRVSLTHVLLESPAMTSVLARIVSERPPDVILAYGSGMARFALERPLAGIPFVLDMVDVDSAKWSSLAEHARWPKRWIYHREARLLGDFEARAARAAHSTLVVNERERETLSCLAPDARIEVIGNGIDVEPLRPPSPPSSDPSVVFCGVMNYPPNEEGALWLAREVWPYVRARYPAAHLALVGSKPTPAIRRLASDSVITVTGHVDDVRPYLWRSAVAAAPVRVARGVQNKVLEACAAGLPIVITSAVAAGLPPGVLPACSVADDPDAFAAAICDRLAQSPGERREIASRATLDDLTWERRLAKLPNLLALAIARNAPVSAA